MAEILYNGVEARLAARMTIDSDLMVITDATGFPNEPEFRIRVDDELMVVTMRNGVSSVVERGAEGTDRAIHEAGSVVFVVATKESLEAIRAQPVADTNPILFKSGNQSISVRFSLALVSSAQTYALPNKSGTIALLSDIQQVSMVPATETELGGVKIPQGSGLEIDGDGNLNTRIKSVAGKTDENITLTAQDVGAVPSASVGKGSGVAGPLSPDNTTGTNDRHKAYLGTKVPSSQLPLKYVKIDGDWNADTNTITYVEGGVTYERSLQPNGQIRETWVGGNFTDTGIGLAYRVSTAGDTDLDGLDGWEVGQVVFSTGSRWERLIDRSLSDRVTQASNQATGATGVANTAAQEAQDATTAAGQAVNTANSASSTATAASQAIYYLKSHLEAVVNVGSLTTPFSLVQESEFKYFRNNDSSGFSVGVPLDDTESIGIGFYAWFRQSGSGIISLTPESGVTISGPTQTNIPGDVIVLRKVETDIWETVLLSESGGGGGPAPTFLVQGFTADYTPSSTAEGYYRYTGSSTTTFTIPTNSSVAFAIGAKLHVRNQGTGTLSVVGDTGVTVNDGLGGGISPSGPGAVVTYIKVGTNEWDAVGATT